MGRLVLLALLAIGCGAPGRLELHVDRELLDWNGGEGAQLVSTAVSWWNEIGAHVTVGDGGIPVRAVKWGRWELGAPVATGEDGQDIAIDLLYLDHLAANGGAELYGPNILAHEIGHALGLTMDDHVNDPRAVMYPFAHGNDWGMTQADTDVFHRVVLEWR